MIFLRTKKFAINIILLLAYIINSEVLIQLAGIGANFVVCQGGIEDTANYLLLRTHTNGMRYVSEREIEVSLLPSGAPVYLIISFKFKITVKYKYLLGSKPPFKLLVPGLIIILTTSKLSRAL